VQAKFALLQVEISHTYDTQSLFHKQLSSDSLPLTLPRPLEDGHQLDIVVDLDTSVGVEDLQQVWISFVEKSGIREYLFLPWRRGNGSLAFQVKLDASGIEAFEDRQGDFFVKLVAGDARVTRGIHQLVLDRVTLNYRPKHTPTPKGIFDFDMTTAKFYPQEELEHDLKTPRKRAPIFLSFLFTGLVLLPLLVYIFWIFSIADIFPLRLPFDETSRRGMTMLWCLVFHTSIAGFVYCLVKFWLSWNILQTWKVMLAILPVTVISGMKWMHSSVSSHTTQQTHSKHE
jgi:hypothetical protein